MSAPTRKPLRPVHLHKTDMAVLERRQLKWAWFASFGLSQVFTLLREQFLVEGRWPDPVASG